MDGGLDGRVQETKAIWRDSGELSQVKNRRCLLCRQDGIYSIPDVSKVKDLCRDATEAFRQDADASHTPDVF